MGFRGSVCLLLSIRVVSCPWLCNPFCSDHSIYSSPMANHKKEMKTSLRSSSIIINIPCLPSTKDRTIAALRLYTCRADALPIRLVSFFIGSTKVILSYEVRMRTRTPYRFSSLLADLAHLREVTGYPITDASLVMVPGAMGV